MSNDMVIDADIIDENNNFIISYSDLVIESILKWEKLILTHLPEYSSEILKRINNKELFQKRQTNLQHLIDEMSKVFEFGEWVEIQSNEIKKGMVVWAGENEVYDDLHKGIVNALDDKTINLVTDNPIFPSIKIKVIKKKWKIFIAKKPNDLMVLNHFYLNFMRLYNELINLWMSIKNTPQHSI